MMKIFSVIIFVISLGLIYMIYRFINSELYASLPYSFVSVGLRNALRKKSRNIRMVFIVNSSLHMQKGKIISQCMHGYDAIVNREYFEIPADSDNAQSFRCLLKRWRKAGSAKIVLKATEEQICHIKDLLFENKSKDVLFSIICDAGKTQVTPGSNTVIAIGPAIAEDIEKYTAELKLL